MSLNTINNLLEELNMLLERFEILQNILNEKLNQQEEVDDDEMDDLTIQFIELASTMLAFSFSCSFYLSSGYHLNN